jgi:chemotaxis protein methyltransferase CheR
MSPELRVLVAKTCAARAGLRIDADKAYLIESRLGPLARREGFDSVERLARILEGPSDERLAWAIVEAMAPADTAFFRDPPALERLWREAVPELARRRADGAVRIWSVGCAAGQEIYSLAMLQAEEPAPTGQVELFASDLGERQLERARSGLYSSFEVQRGLSARRLVRHFDNRDQQFQLARPLRQAVRWRRVNLMDDLAPLGVFDIVLCRNVLSGLTPEGRARALEGLMGALATDGLLLAGAGEDLAAGPFAPHPGLPGGFVRAHEVRGAA